MARSPLVMLAGLVALLALPGGAQARGLDVRLAAAPVAGLPVSVTWSGDTGPNGAVRGGFVVQAVLARGRAACPAGGFRGSSRRRRTPIAAQNVFVPGPFRGAMQPLAPDAGRHRLCGYLTRSSDRIVYEKLVDRLVTVRRRPAGRRLTAPPRARAGTYVARPTDVVGAADGGGTLRVVLSSRAVTSIAVTGLRLSVCDGLTPAHPQLNTRIDLASRGPLGAGSASFRASSFAASLLGPPPDGRLSLHGGASTAREIRGVVVGTTADGNCQGSFAFVARR